MTQRDELDELVADRDLRRPGFAALVDEHVKNRAIIRQVAARRIALGLSQTQVAAFMGTSQAAVNRIERGEADLLLSTMVRYAAACGQRLGYTLEQDESLTPLAGTR